MAKTETGIGAAVPRKEDYRFLTGGGRFTDDIQPADGLAAAVVRAPHPHAAIVGIDVDAARAAPGVRLVLTASDLDDEIAGPVPSFSNTPPFDVARRNAGPAADMSQYPLARGKVRYLGEPVAFVVAETADQARDAAELVAVDYDPLPAVMEIADALAPDAPEIWPDAPDNISFEWDTGDRVATDAAFAAAAHISRLRVVNNRVVIAFMEPRGALGSVSAAGRLTLEAGCQSAHGMRAGLARVLGVEETDLHVQVPDTGGGFGARNGVYPEFVLALVAARRLGRPVKWTARRDEAFLTDNQARDHVFDAELALDREGRFLGLRVRGDWRHGAYFANRSIWVMTHYLSQVMGGPYRLSTAFMALRGVVSNTTPQAAYRGIGRLEINYVLERLIDQAARELGIGRLELRRRNLVGAEEFPWRMPGGAIVTSGDFSANLDHAAKICDWAGAAARRDAAEALGRLYGIGLAMYAENDGSTPTEFAGVSVSGDGRVTMTVGTQDFGMGHATMYSQILSDRLGVPFDEVDVVFGDSDRVRRGMGTHGSRSARMGGTAAWMGADRIIERARDVASEMLEAAAGDVEFADGRFTIVGTDRSVALYEVAAETEARGDVLLEEADFNAGSEAISNGAHVCEVTIDPETGHVWIESYAIVADVGRIVNPIIVHGQVHGGAAQGIGQALLEQVAYDRRSGQTLTGSFMDYCLPRADDLAGFHIAFNEVAERDNPLGVKGAGESGTTGAPAAVMNAIADALCRVGADPVDMPATPEKIWRALHAARGTKLS